ncbi:MAG: hypothetical protein FRX49_07682 [Trebouxia sp. A1-2]|nr:MAG: hypothetical protein FRX49_07682 [Trebouxia sp. A1-2]
MRFRAFLALGTFFAAFPTLFFTSDLTISAAPSAPDVAGISQRLFTKLPPERGKGTAAFPVLCAMFRVRQSACEKPTVAATMTGKQLIDKGAKLSMLLVDAAESVCSRVDVC